MNVFTKQGKKGFTLVELLVVLVIVAILSSLSLAGLLTARARAKYTKTESTIRKIHEIIMPHYEGFLDRKVPVLQDATGGTLPALQIKALVERRRAIATELPDSWTDLLAPTLGSGDFMFNGITVDREATIVRRLRRYIAEADISNEDGVQTRSSELLTRPNGMKNADSETLFACVMFGGFADPNIVTHFRGDEISDTNGNELREFIDGWGRPIRFLRWAPGFISRYQTGAGHDAFDITNSDPAAVQTLFPLIFSAGPDGVSGLVHRPEKDTPSSEWEDDISFSYHSVLYDPWFKTRTMLWKREGGTHPGDVNYSTSAQNAYPKSFGTIIDNSAAGDNFYNHSMSR